MKSVHRATFSKCNISFLGVLGVTSIKKARFSADFRVTPFVTPFIFFGVTFKMVLQILIKWQLASVIHRDKAIRVREGLLVILRFRFLRILIFVVNIQRILFF